MSEPDDEPEQPAPTEKPTRQPTVFNEAVVEGVEANDTLDAQGIVVSPPPGQPQIEGLAPEVEIRAPDEFISGTGNATIGVDVSAVGEGIVIAPVWLTPGGDILLQIDRAERELASARLFFSGLQSEVAAQYRSHNNPPGLLDDPSITEEDFLAWIPLLERALSDPLGGLIHTYGKAVRDHPKSTINNLDELLKELHAASKVRNAICHGSWRAPDSDGHCMLLYVTKKGELFVTAIDTEYLEKLQLHVRGLAVAVINSVTHMGWQFPGSAGPGMKVI